MIAPTIIDEIRRHVCNSIGVNEVEQGLIAVDIPITFPDGDQCRVYVSQDETGAWSVTDAGDAVMRASYQGSVDVLGKGYVERFRQITDLYGISEDMGELSIVSDGDIGQAVFSVAQATIDIISLARTRKDKPENVKSDFEKKLHDVVFESVPNARITQNWNDDEHDPDKLYPVTYRIENKTVSEKPLFVFGANTKSQCMHATMSCLFHKTKVGFRSIAIYGKMDRVGKSEFARLNREVEKHFPSIKDSAEMKDYIAQMVG